MLAKKIFYKFFGNPIRYAGNFKHFSQNRFIRTEDVIKNFYQSFWYYTNAR